MRGLNAVSRLLLFSLVAFSGSALCAEYGAGTRLTSKLEYLVSEAKAPPVSEEWESIHLPLFRASPYFDDMRDQETLWFRVPVETLLVDVKELQSLYIWRHNMRLIVFLDDIHLGGTIRPQKYGWPSIGWNHPVLVDLPFDRSNPERTQMVYLRIEGGPGGIILSPLVSGSRTALQEAFKVRNRVQIEAAQWCFVLCLLLAGLSFWLWCQRRRERLYLKFAAMSLLSAVTLTFFFLEFIPFNLRLWLFVQHAASDWIAYFMVGYAALALEQRWHGVQKFMLGACIIATTLYAVLPDFYFQPMAYLIHSLLSLVVVGVGFRILYLTWQQPSGTRIWFSLASVGFFVVNTHDYSAVFLSTPEEHILASNWLQFSPPLMATAFFAHLVHRFVSALEISEQLNRNLETRVEQMRQALEASFAENRAMELQDSADAERQKIYRELHDNLGSKLVSIVHSAEGSKQSELARGALESLRESIYRTRHANQSLNEFVDAIGVEAELRLEGAGLTFTFEADELPDQLIEPETAYNLTRILREGVSNILQHAKAPAASLLVERAGSGLSISLIDQGVGHAEKVFAAGGLSNIEYRASRIEATVNWLPGDPGCRLQVLIPRLLQA